MRYEYDDGGRAAAGYMGGAGDCVCRAIAIATGRPYTEIYRRLAQETGSQRASKRSKRRTASAANGINTGRKWFKDQPVGIGVENQERALRETSAIRLLSGRHRVGEISVRARFG